MDDIKVIFIDVDGTILNDDGVLTNYTVEVLNKIRNKNISIVLCSGRHNNSVCEISKKINASGCAISSNGALLYDYNNNIIINKELIEFKDIKKIWNYLSENKIGCFLNTVDSRYANKYITNKKYTNKIIIDDVDKVSNKDIYQIIVVADSYNKCKKAFNYLNDNKKVFPINVSTGFKAKIEDMNYYFIDYVKKGVNKGLGIRKYLEYYNIDMKNTLCFGDHINDAEMFDACNYKVAMGNANLELKNKATYIIKTNNEDGVAKFLEDKLL